MLGSLEADGARFAMVTGAGAALQGGAGRGVALGRKALGPTSPWWQRQHSKDVILVVVCR